MSTENLWCKVGKHYYDREVTRGRKPVACPDHRGGDVDTLIRAPGLTHADRMVDGIKESQEWAAERVAAERVETLTCEHGHTWTRKPTRGRKPRLCPEHAPVPQVAAPRPVAALSEPQEASAPVIKVRKVNTSSRMTVAEVQEHFVVDPETVYKLQYIEREVLRGREDVGDLLRTQKLLIERLQREHRVRVPVAA